MTIKITRKVKDYIKDFSRKFGYELIHQNSLKNLERETFHYHLKCLFKKLNIQCVLDVGANIGGYRNFLRNKVAYDGLILSFEPIKKNIEILKDLAKEDSSWFIYDFALGNGDTKKQINSMKQSCFSSFLEPDDSTVGWMKNITIQEKENVTIKKLDSIINLIKRDHLIGNTYLKMDTQGYDLEVIKGAENSLSEILALQTEVSMRKIYKNMPGFFDVYQILMKKGYDITGMFPVTRDSLLRVIEFDCVMINNRFLAKDIKNK